jgi:hypothetical protein
MPGLGPAVDDPICNSIRDVKPLFHRPAKRAVWGGIRHIGTTRTRSHFSAEGDVGTATVEFRLAIRQFDPSADTERRICTHANRERHENLPTNYVMIRRS